MNQTYAEAGVKRQDDAKTMALRALLIVGMLMGAFLLTVGSFFSIIGVIIFAAMIFLFPRLRVEYEYIYVDGQIDFDRISGQSKRKTILRLDMEKVDIVAPHGSHALDSYNHLKLEVRDFSSGRKDIKPYIIIASDGEKKYRVLFEPSESMLTAMKQKSPRKISQI